MRPQHAKQNSFSEKTARLVDTRCTQKHQVLDQLLRAKHFKIDPTMVSERMYAWCNIFPFLRWNPPSKMEWHSQNCAASMSSGWPGLKMDIYVRLVRYWSFHPTDSASDSFFSNSNLRWDPYCSDWALSRCVLIYILPLAVIPVHKESQNLPAIPSNPQVKPGKVCGLHYCRMPYITT